MARIRFRIPTLGKRGNSGSAAVEFAMIAPAFFLMFFASFETGMTYFASMALENGLIETSRLIRTGQAQAQNMTQTQFRDALCGQINMLLSCDADQLYIDVRAFNNFGGSSYQDALDENGDLNPNLNTYQPGQSSATTGTPNIVLVRVFYKWKLYTPLFAEYYANLAGDYRLLTTSVAFRNEPF